MDIRPDGREVSLKGGRVTDGVVRVGDTVRRPRQPSSEFTAKLLTLLEHKKANIVPEYKGVDARGRDIFSYVEGEVPSRFKRFTDEQVAQAAVVIRRFHDATRGSSLAGNEQVVCHHDAGPNNFVFQEGAPAVLIDFDLASPGNPLEDIGYMAWLWCISSKPDRQPTSDQASQVRTLVDSYGFTASERKLVFDAIVERQTWNVGFWHEYLAHPKPEVATPKQVLDRIAWTMREQAYTLDNRAIFIARLA